MCDGLGIGLVKPQRSPTFRSLSKSFGPALHFSTRFVYEAASPFHFLTVGVLKPSCRVPGAQTTNFFRRLVSCTVCPGLLEFFVFVCCLRRQQD